MSDFQIDTTRKPPARPLFRFSLRQLLLFIFICSLNCFLLFRIVVPALVIPKHDAMANHCGNNLKQIGLALVTYHDIYGCFPPPFVRDESGRPAHSWRRLILDQLESHPPGIVWPIDMSEPWDSPKNLAAAKQFVPPCYYCAAEHHLSRLPQRPPASGTTNYVMIVGEETATPAERCVSTDEMRKGTSRTVIVAEIADSNILWTEPRDLNFEEMSFHVNDKSKPSISSHHFRGAWLLFADGHIQFVSDTTDPATLKALLTRSPAE